MTWNIPGLKIASGVKRINHSQFMHDILLLGEAFTIMERQFKSILDQFLLVSRGLVNSNKCYLYVWNTSSHSLAVIARILQFPLVVNWRYFKYLGIPICINPVSAASRNNSLYGEHNGSVWKVGQFWLNWFFQLSPFFNIPLHYTR